MLQLRIVGVDAEGGTPALVLSDNEGGEYRVAVDEALRAAIAQVNSPTRTAEADQRQPMSPRQIQAKLRAGASVDDVVASSGQAREYVLRFAGPIADERAFYAARARETVVARASSGQTHRLAFGDAPATLEAMTSVRLRQLGVSSEEASWDAWRREDGTWTVVCDFTLAEDSDAGTVGERPPARWVFNPSARSLRPENKWAETLMKLPAATTTPSSRRRRLAPVDEPFDVDSSAGSAPPQPATEPHPAGQTAPGGGPSTGHDAEDLLEILRARRGQRLGTDHEAEDKLATMLTRDESAPATVSPLRAVGPDDTDEEPSEKIASAEETASGEEHTTGALPGMEQFSEETETDSATDAWGFSYQDGDEDPAESGSDTGGGGPSDTEPATADQGPHQHAQDQSRSEDSTTDSPADEAHQPAPPKRRSSTRKSRRPTMPSWDDILFGSKDD
ncbi:septation protein SepH [Nesterenkonia alba]|uniref:septation protein SepH n=1 Tax=Nesterenkonia alba TaxID=515814 RepID=UPI0003B3183E|nr:septation protein SepH [Nesterenkonia alba]